MTTWLTDSLRTRAGALAPAAERFLRGWLGDDASAFRGGARGLILLCDHMEHWLGLDAVDDEHGFVEGAGALLGVLLLDHLGEAAPAAHVARGSVHRLKLGRHGFFDPFTAVDRALDADSVRDELARQVALAEAEAAERGPISRVVSALLLALALKRPELTLAGHFDLTLWLRGAAGDEPLELDLTRAVESTREQSDDAVHALVDKLLTMLPGAGDVLLDFTEARTRLVPRLARAESLRELGTGQGALFGKQLTEELVVALLVEYQGRARYVKSRELDGWGVRPAQALELALDNLSLRSERTRIACTHTDHGPLWVARTGDGRDSARVLLKSLYDTLTTKLGAHLFVGIPHRDTFFACAGDNDALLQELARRTAHDAARAPHRLSARLFKLTAEGLLD